MTSMQQTAVNLIQALPEEQVAALVGLMQTMMNRNESVLVESEEMDSMEAFRELEKLCRPIPNLDDEKELAEWREEKFGYAGSD